MSDKTVDLSEWVEKKERQKQRNVVPAATVTIDAKLHARLARAQIMLAALVKREGRIRIPWSEIQDIDRRGKLDVKVGDNGDVTVSYKER